MMIRAKWLLAALALPLMISTAFAAIDPDKLPQVACSDLEFSKAFLAKYPKAPAACQDARVYKGQRYAKFVAKVYISSPQFMTVELLDTSRRDRDDVQLQARGRHGSRRARERQIEKVL